MSFRGSEEMGPKRSPKKVPPNPVPPTQWPKQYSISPLIFFILFVGVMILITFYGKNL